MVSGVGRMCFPAFCGVCGKELISGKTCCVCLACMICQKRTIGSVRRIPCFAPFLPSRFFQVPSLFFFSETQALTVNCYIGLNTMDCVK